MSPIPSRTLAARVAGRLRVAALLALLLTQIAPALAIDTDLARSAPAAPNAAGVTAMQADMLLVDVNGNRRVDPGDTLRYTVAIDNGNEAALAGLAFEETLNPSTTLVAGSLQVGPLAYPDSYAANHDTMLAIAAPGLLANDTGTPAPAVTTRSVTTAAGGTAATSADGSFSYTPPPGYTGIDSFSYSADNPAGNDTGTVTLTVRAVPVAVDDSYTVIQNSARSIPAPGVLANDIGFPPPTATLNGATTAGGTVNLAANGGFSYTPPAGFTGSDTFVYSAINSAGSDTATVTLTVGIAPLAQNDQSFTLNMQVATPKLRGGNPSVAAPLSVSLGALPAGKHVAISFDVLIANPLPVGVSRLINQGIVSASGIANILTDDPDLPGAANPTITFVGTRRIFMPLLIKVAGPPLADLVVESISSVGGKVSITVRNDGPAPVVDAFWIDLYIDPANAPVRVNQLWSDVGSRGATWGVIDNALPLAPGARLTVTLGDSFYRPLLSNPGGAITVGTQLYAQVDSFNATSSNGAVFETHERDGGAYNNILGPVAP